MEKEVVKFENVTKIYYPKKKNQSPTLALDGVSFSVQKGEFILLVGKSGAGKTTALKLILGQERPTQGKVFFQGIEISSLPRSKMSFLRRKIGTVFQDYKLLEQKTAIENLIFVLEALGWEEKLIQRDANEVLEIVGLEEKSHCFPAELSAGEKQKLAIARALISRPELILADEPTGNLDFYNTLEIINLLKKINKMGTTIILATHDREIVKRIKNRKIVLEKGKIIEDEKNVFNNKENPKMGI